MTKRPRTVVSGMRPTGRLHLGHYHGVIENWTKLQEDKRFSAVYYFIADWHALTTEYAAPGEISAYTRENVIDWLAFGVDPKKAMIFVQSQVPEHAELHLILSMYTPISWLERVPSYKEMQRELKDKDLSTYGFLGYPLLQTADVALYHGTDVPVGQDQVAHIELAREIVRRFNNHVKKDVLAQPQCLLTPVPKLVGTDGRKMSKSYGNSIFLSETSSQVHKKILPMMTDPARVKRSDPGDPNKCPVFDYHKIYTGEEEKAYVVKGCTTAGIGCIDCKKILLKNMDARLEPMRERRFKIAKDKDYVNDVIATGNARAHKVAAEHMKEIREVLKV